MNEHTIGGDAHIPSDTEQFDKQANLTKKPPKRAVSITEGVKLQMQKNSEEFTHLMRRISSYIQFHLQNTSEKAAEAGVGPNVLAVEAYANLRITMAQIQVMVENLQNGVLVPTVLENKKRVNEILAEYLKEWEEGYGIEITEEGVKIQRQEGGPGEDPGANADGAEGRTEDQPDDGHGTPS